MSSVLSEVLILDGERSVSSVGGNFAATVLSPGGVFVSGNKRNKQVDIYPLRVSFAHAYVDVSKAIVQQHRSRLVGELALCSGCSMVKRIHAITPHHTTAKARAPIDLPHLDIAGFYPQSFGGSRSVVVFIGSACRRQRPYGIRGESAPIILAIVKRFVVDRGGSRAFRTDNGFGYTTQNFVEYCDDLGILRKFTIPYIPHQNDFVESALASTIKAGLSACIEANKLFPDVHSERVKVVRDRFGMSL